MMKKTFNQNCIIRRSGSKDGATASVYLRITVNGVRTEISLQRNCDPVKWDPARGRLIGKTEDIRSFNAYLDAVQGKIYEIFQSFISSGMEFDGEKIKAKYLGLDVEKQKNLLDVYEAHNKEFELLVGKGLSYRTLQKYKTIKDLRNCLVHHYTVGDCYGLTRRNAGLHLKPDPNKSEMIVLNLETFIEDLENGFDKYIVDLRSNKDGLWDKAITAFNKEHQGSDKKMRKRGIIGYARY